MNGQILAALGMVVVIAASNSLVEVPINNWLTWGAFMYPFTFFITELTNYYHGAKKARQVVYIGFAVAILFGISMMNQRIALASCLAFLVGQLLDISLFNRLRRKSWWVAPGVASVCASGLDTLIFFSAAFAGQDIPWVTLAMGDFAVKYLMDLTLLLPFRAILWKSQKAPVISQFQFVN